MVHLNAVVKMKITLAAPTLIYIANLKKTNTAVILMNMFAMENANILIFLAVITQNLIANIKI